MAAESRQNPQPTDFIKIGLVLPSRSEYPEEAKQLLLGAKLALTEANRSGGFAGRMFELAARSTEGPWQSGSNEIVKLVFEDNVWAITGTVDGRSAHLVQQIATKAQVPFVVACATDPTVTQSFIPWVFRTMPDDRKQTAVLAEEIFLRRRLSRIALLHDQSYDSKMASKVFQEIAQTHEYAKITPFELNKAAAIDETTVEQLRDLEAQGFVLFLEKKHAPAFVQKLRTAGLKQPCFVPLQLAEAAYTPSSAPIVAVTPGNWQAPGNPLFEETLQTEYRGKGGAVSAYTYDSILLIVDAIRRAGLDKAAIRDAIASVRIPDGVTGSIQFDEHGNRRAPVRILELPLDSKAF
jgi:ABC-type branched-subunit amino acid transport system substrate-binding protein